MALVVLGAGGCTTFREIPRAEYATRSERKNVAIETSEGLHYEFETVKIGSDSLVGYHRHDSEGSFEEFDSVPLPLDQIRKLSARKIDWYKTGLVGGAGVGAVILGAIARRHGGSGTEPINPCGPGGCPD